MIANTAETIAESLSPADAAAPGRERVAPLKDKFSSSGVTPMQQRREKTREQILEATRAALVEVGFERITTRRIAVEAKVNIATLHYYFGTKEALLAEAVRYSQAVVEGRLRTAIENATTAADALGGALGEVWAIVREGRGALRYDVVVRGFRDEEARREANALYGIYYRLVEEIVARHVAAGGSLAPGLTPEGFARYLVAAVDGVVLQYTINGDDEAVRVSLSLIQQHALQLMGVGRTNA